MIRTPRVLAVLALAALAWPAAAETSAPAPSGLRDHVAYLASADLEGRLTGSAGARAAADYLVTQLQALGARPLPQLDGFRIPFEFTAGMTDGGSSLVLAPAGAEPQRVEGTEAIQALSFSDSSTVRGPVVFAGYGLKLPDDGEFPYDSFHGLDLDGKVVVALRYFPEDVDTDTRALLARYSGLRFKAMQARERGAKALIVVAGPNSPNAGEIVPMTFDTALSGSGIVAASVSGAIAERIFAHVPDKTLKDVQTALDSGNPHVTGFEIPGLEIELTVDVVRERQTDYDVVGMLPANGPTKREGYVMVGAHFDHLGRGGNGNSLANKDESGGIHHGADDNASGVAVVLDIARRLKDRPRDRDLMIAFWSGEEMGLLGSTHFAKWLEDEGVDVQAYLNLDMVGRMKEDKLSVQSVGSSEVWPKLIEQSNVPVGLDLAISQDPYLPTDSAAFYNRGIPALNLFTGSHEDYHRPSDTAEKLNYDGMESIAKFGALLTWKMTQLEEPPAYVAVERQREEGGGRDSVRAYTGTIPDYTTEAEGLLLSGVVGGGPADEAGLREGDLIVEFGGKTIANIYDYTYALDAVKIGEPIDVVFIRDGERKTVTLTPRSR